MSEIDNVRRILLEVLANGQLERKLRKIHRGWWFVLPFDDFRIAVVEKVWAKRSTFNGTTAGEFLAWLHRVSTNVAIEAGRQREREARLLRGYLREAKRWFVGPNADVETREYVDWLLRGLTERERLVLRSRYFKGMSCAEIATMMGVKADLIRQVHYRALQKLRKMSEQ